MMQSKNSTAQSFCVDKIIFYIYENNCQIFATRPEWSSFYGLKRYKKAGTEGMNEKKA